MAILAECPMCHRKQSIEKKKCAKCGGSLDKSKRSGKVRYHIRYRMPDGRQKSEFIGYSISEARDADGKRRGEKRENSGVFNMCPYDERTFNELADWYLDLKSTKRLADYSNVGTRLNNFNAVHGDKMVNIIRPMDIDDYYIERKEQGIKPVTIDGELGNVKGMVKKAFFNDMVGAKVYKIFQGAKKKSKKSERERDRILTLQEYLGLIENAAQHERDMQIVAFHTGMRPSELRGLQWKFIDRKIGFIRLPADFTKEKSKRVIPINPYVAKVLDRVQRHIDHDLVFTYKGQPLRRSKGPSDAFKTACKKAGIPCGKKVENGIIPHDMRRTFKSNCLKAGIDKAYRDKLTGHSLRGMDAHYIKPTEGDLMRAMVKFTAWYREVFSAIVDHPVTTKGVNN